MSFPVTLKNRYKTVVTIPILKSRKLRFGEMTCLRLYI